MVNLDDKQLRQLQLIELEMLLEVDRICRKYQIKYVITGGTLLGAVRHKGFIPWDDDLDFGLMREDYTKLLNFCKKNYIVTDYNKNYKKSEWNYVTGYGQVRPYLQKYPKQYILDVWLDQIQIFYGSSLAD